MPLEALIFDVDGTLAETEDIHRQCFNAAFAGAGLDWHWSPEAYARLLQVTGGKERIRRYADGLAGSPALDEAAIRRLHAAKTGHYVAAVQAGSVTLRPGVRRLLHEARDAGLRLAIATTTTPENVDALLSAALGREGPGLFEVIGAGDMVPRKKPAPDIYRLVLDRLGLPPERCVAFEDTANGLRSALGAGLRVVVTASAYGGAVGEGALCVLDGLGEPDAPCRVLAGAWPPGARSRAMLDMDTLKRLAACGGSA